MKKSTLFSILTIFLLVPATLLLGRHIKGRWYYLTSTLVIIEIMLPFFASFESRKPQSRELVTLAVMAALATASRVAFVFIPYFKAITGVIMITALPSVPRRAFSPGPSRPLPATSFSVRGLGRPGRCLPLWLCGLLGGAYLPWPPEVVQALDFGHFRLPFHFAAGWPYAGLLHRVYGAQQAYLEKCPVYFRPGCPCQYRSWHWLRRDADGADEAPAV